MHFQINGKSVSCARALKTFKLGKLVFDILTIYNFLPQNEEEVKGNTLVGSFAFCFGIHLNFWWRTLYQANQGTDRIIIAFFFGKREQNRAWTLTLSVASFPVVCFVHFLLSRSSCFFPVFPVPRFRKPFPFTWSASVRIWNIKECIYTINNWFGHVHVGLFVV